MWDNDRRRSRRLSDYTDRLILRRRNDGGQPGAPEDPDPEVEALSLLAAELTDLDVAPSPAFEDDLLERLRERHTHEPQASAPRLLLAAAANRIASLSSTLAVAATPARAAIAAALLIAIGVFNYLGQPPVVSAAEVLARSDEALAATVHPGELLKRTWQVRLTSWAHPGALPVIRDRVVDEWMDGDDFDHVAGKSITADGFARAWASRRDGGQIYTVGYVDADAGSGEPAALNLEPTRKDYLLAADGFPPEARRLLHTYLNRSFIYMSIAGERRFNRELLEGTLSGPMPRSVKVEHVTEEGRPAFAVRTVDPARVVFLWRSGRVPYVQLTHDDTVSYIAKDSYLTIKSTRDIEYPSGRRSTEVRTLAETRTYKTGELVGRPFEIDVPAWTRVNQQSAVELLTEVLRVLQGSQADGR